MSVEREGPATGDGQLVDVVETAADAERLEVPPLVIREHLEAELPGEGRLELERLGEGHSNITFLVRRGADEWVLRRPPRPPYAPTAHDVLREYRVLSALADRDVRAPSTVHVCEDKSVIGAPFYLMERIHGHVIRHSVPDVLADPSTCRFIAEELVDALVELHSVDWNEAGLAGLGKPTGYLERQLRRWLGQWDKNRTREIHAVDEVGRRLEQRVPKSPPATIVHGDYKLDNVVYEDATPARLAAILDWEMATLGDPLADLGYMTATYVEQSDPKSILDISGPTRMEGFPTRAELIDRYEQATGRSMTDLPWYQALALWKLGILLEGSYRRLLAGTTDDPFFKLLDRAVPELANRALEFLDG